MIKSTFVLISEPHFIRLLHRLNLLAEVAEADTMQAIHPGMEKEFLVEEFVA